VLLAPFESLGAWHPYAWLSGGVLLLCALQGNAEAPRFVRGFVVVVHVAALLAAWRNPGWIDQALAAPWNESDYLGSLPRLVDGWLPAGTLATTLRWITLGACVLIPAGLLVPGLQRAAAALAIAFYALVHLAVGGPEVALFTGALCIAQISFLEWPRFIVVTWPRACGWPLWLRVALDRYDFEHRTDWPRPADPDGELEVSFDGQTVTGARAIANLVLRFPVFYFFMLASSAAALAVLPQRVGAPAMSALAFCLVGFSLVATFSHWRSRWHQRRVAAAVRTESKPAAATSADRASPTATPSTPGERDDVTDITVEIDTPPPPDR
jgi:hypothetical protein